MIIAAIDSAELAGVAVLARDDAGAEQLLHHSARRILTAGDVEDVVAGLFAYEPDLVVVEEPFIHPQRPGAGLALAILFGRWRQSLERLGLATTGVPASMWQTGLLPGINTRARSETRKIAAQAFVRSAFALEVGEDEADAIALAVYVARNATRRPAPPARKAVAHGR